MKRKKFIQASILTAFFPFKTFAKNENIVARIDKGFKIKAGEGRLHGHIKLKGINANIIDVKISGKDTDGDLALFEQTGITQGRGVPLHIHPFQDELFYVLEGEYYFKVGEDKYHLTAGESIFLPRKIPHAWTQVSKKAKTLVLLQPAGKLEDFFITIAALKEEPTKEQIAKIFADNDMEIVGPLLKIE
ncbi:MAG: cupin domain-containing protein [Ferruginibacter sp.]|nr:cupin domain-containing protein [Ferruginibacter sp.]